MLHLFRKILPEEPVPPVDFLPRRCLRSRCNSFDCQRCVQVCGSGALQLREGRISFDASLCTGCMRCSTVCLNDALHTTVDFTTLLAGLPADGEVFICCDRQPRQRAEEVPLPCLGLFSAEALIGLLVKSTGRVVFDLTACPGCPNRESSAAFVVCLERVQQLCRPLFRGEVCLFRGDGRPGSDEEADRRHYLSGLTFKAWFGEAQPAGARPNLGQPVNDTRRRVSDRCRLVQCLAEGLDQSGRDLLRRVAVPQLRLSESCRLCPRCAGICPSGALRFERNGGEKRLLYDALRCSGCGLCVTFCQEGALELIQAPIVAAIFDAKEKVAVADATQTPGGDGSKTI